MMDPVAGLREPDRIPARTPSDVSHDRGWGRKMPSDDLLRPFELDHAECRAQTLALFVPLVVGVNLSVARLHRRIVAAGSNLGGRVRRVAPSEVVQAVIVVTEIPRARQNATLAR